MLQDSKLLYEMCTKIRLVSDRDLTKEFTTIVNDDDIKKLITMQASKFTKQNKELDFSDLLNDIKTNLFITIKNEFDIDTKADNTKAWLFSVIRWRTLDFIREECTLNYDAEKKQYKRIKKKDIGMVDQTSIISNKTKPKIKGDVDGYQYLEFLIRKAKISTFNKTVLILYYVFGYSLSEMIDIFPYSSQLMKERLEKAVKEFTQSLEKTNLYTKEELYNILN